MLPDLWSDLLYVHTSRTCIQPSYLAKYGWLVFSFNIQVYAIKTTPKRQIIPYHEYMITDHTKILLFFHPKQYHSMGPHGISVQLVIDLYRGDRFVAATNHTVKMCIYSSTDYVLDFYLSISVSS